MNDKKDFNDLVFNAHANVENGIQASLDLGNSITISVVSMKERTSAYGGLYGDASEGTYEVAVFRNGDMLPLSAWDDVVGWQTEAEVSKLMDDLQGKSEDVHAFVAELYVCRDESNAKLMATD